MTETTAANPSQRKTPRHVAGDTVTRITPAERVVTPCSSVVGLLREACIDQDDVWIGMVSAEPGTASQWHDHGDRTTYLLPLEGEGTIEYEGPNGRGSTQVRADGSVYVTPPHVRHREVNDSTTPLRGFLIRIGPKGRGSRD
jgi:quercetin dioxygenase-like cupin family protein